MKQVVRQIASITGNRVDIQIGAVDNIPGEMWQTTGNPELAYNVLKCKAKYNLEQGLAETIRWFEMIGFGLKNYT